MEQYGTLLDDFEPEKNELYESISSYFNDPKMTKTKNKDGYSVYMCKTQCMLGGSCRYLIALTEQDQNNINTSAKLSEIRWDSFQTRTLEDSYPNVNTCGYFPQKKGPLTIGIEKIGENNDTTTYKCEKYNITVTLMNGKNTVYYQNKGTVIAALETYNTIISFN